MSLVSKNWNHHTLAKTALHEHPVEPPGRRPPRDPLRYLLAGVLAIAGFVALLALIDAMGWFGR